MIRTTAQLKALYETSRWRRAAAAFRRLHPFCMWPGCHQRVEVVDHVVPRSTARSDAELQALTWDRRNWQSLCKAHHDEKTRHEQEILRSGPTVQASSSAIVTRDYSRGAV